MTIMLNTVLIFKLSTPVLSWVSTRCLFHFNCTHSSPCSPSQTQRRCSTIWTATAASVTSGTVSWQQERAASCQVGWETPSTVCTPCRTPTSPPDPSRLSPSPCSSASHLSVQLMESVRRHNSQTAPVKHLTPTKPDSELLSQTKNHQKSGVAIRYYQLAPVQVDIRLR